jgi:hypothetical protein
MIRHEVLPRATSKLIIDCPICYQGSAHSTVISISWAGSTIELFSVKVRCAQCGGIATISGKILTTLGRKVARLFGHELDKNKIRSAKKKGVDPNAKLHERLTKRAALVREADANLDANLDRLGKNLEELGS